MININIINARNELKNGKNIYDMNLRVVYYARVSTDSDEQLNSLDNQKKYFEEYINNNKNWKLVGGYIDEGISGTRVQKRKEFLSMIDDGTNDLFDMIITKEVSRFARNTIDSIKYTDYLLKHGVIVNFLNDNINTLDETCEFRLTIMSSLAQDEVRKLSSRVKFGLARSVKDGKVLGGGNITGYYKKNGRLYINDKEAPMIRMLFSLYATGKYGFRKISQLLYDNNYTNSKGNKYADRVLRRMITNPKYKGYYCGNISYVEDYKTHKKVYRPTSEWIIYKDTNIPAIVSEDIWDKANEIYNKKSLEYKKSKYNKVILDNKYTYTSKLECIEHKCNFSRHGCGKRTNNPVWQCLEYHKGGLKACKTPTLLENKLDDIFKDIISKYMIDKNELIDNIVNDYKTIINDNSYNNKINQLVLSNKRLYSLKDKLLELNLDGYISNREFKVKNDNYNKEIKSNLSLINDIKNNNVEDDIKLIRNTLDEIISIDNCFKDMFDILIKKVYVSKINEDRNNIMLRVLFNYDSYCMDVLYSNH